MQTRPTKERTARCGGCSKHILAFIIRISCRECVYELFLAVISICPVDQRVYGKVMSWTYRVKYTRAESSSKSRESKLETEGTTETQATMFSIQMNTREYMRIKWEMMIQPVPTRYRKWFGVSRSNIAHTATHTITLLLLPSSSSLFLSSFVRIANGSLNTQQQARCKCHT